MVRLPLTVIAIVFEVALVLAGTGIAPPQLTRILAAPAYAVHLALRLVIPGGGFVLYALLFVGGSVVVDLLIRRLLQVHGRRPKGAT